MCVRLSRCSCSRCSSRRRNSYDAVRLAASSRPTYPPAPSAASASTRRRDVQRFVVAAVHELQQLDGELDIAQPAGAELQLAGPLPGGHQLLDAAAHGLHLGHEVLALARRPHHRHQRRDVLGAQLGVARGGPRLHQRLELPGLGPALVVGDVGFEGPHQRARACLRAAAPRRPRRRRPTRTASSRRPPVWPSRRPVSATKMTSTSLT